MSPSNRDAKKHVKAIQRRRLHAKERHAHQQRQAQRDIDALHQALHDVGVPADLVIEIAGAHISQPGKWSIHNASNPRVSKT